MNDDELRHSLYDLARAVGVQTEYWDVRGQHHVASVDALLAVLGALRLPVEVLGDLPAAWAHHLHAEAGRTAPPVLVSFDGAPLAVDVRLPEGADVDRCHLTLLLEDGGELDLGTAHFDDKVGQLDDLGGERVLTRRLSFTGEWPAGYHTAVLDLPGRPPVRADVLAAPGTVAGPPPDERSWGVFSPLYALRRATGPGPVVADLDALGALVAPCGGAVVATLPLLAGYFERPWDPSPYSPISRLFWNELYLDLADLPEAGDAGVVRDLLGRSSVRHELDALRAATQFPTRRQADLVRRVLGEAVVDARAEGRLPDVSTPGPGDLDDYARYRAAVAAHGTGWHGWPAEQRAGDLAGLALDADVIAYHRVAQAAMQRQLAGVADGLAARGQRLYLDLPVGVHADGYDAWRHQDLFATGISVGAPPDDFFAEGQSWGFPPAIPAAAQATGHRYWRDCLRHHMQVAGVLRLDHVMGLHRLFWVPDGLSAREGVYVLGPREEQLAVLAIESHRHDCWVVGEDLGTVPDEVREAMWRHQMLGMHVAEFQIGSWPGAAPDPAPARTVASLDTHDTPTFAGFLAGTDIERRVADGQLDPADAEGEHERRRQQADNLTGHLVGSGLLAPGGGAADVAAAAGELLGHGESALVLVTLEDLWGELEPQNVPGTPVDRPNWVHRCRDTLTDLGDDDAVQGAFTRLEAAREGARARARLAAAPEEDR